MKKKYFNALMLSALTLVSCTDSSYDLNDIDTNSRFYVNGLSVPMNMDPVKLDLMLDIADDSDIKKGADGTYYFQKEGEFKSDPINVNKITLTKPQVDVKGDVKIKIQLDEDIRAKIQLYASNVTMGDLLNNAELMAKIGLTPEMEVFHVNFDNKDVASEINLSADNIDKNVNSIKALGIDRAVLNIQVKVKDMDRIVGPFALNNLKIVMPRGFDAIAIGQGYVYDSAEGVLYPNNEKHDLQLDGGFAADMSLAISGLDYDVLSEGKKLFDPDKHTFRYQKVCSASGEAVLKMKDLKPSIKYADIVALEAHGASYDCNIGFDKDLSVNSFDGEISYSMDDIKVDPVKLSGVPDMLKEAGTNIDLNNPQIYLDITNSLSEYGIKVNTELEIKGNNDIKMPLNITSDPKTMVVMSPSANGLVKTGYTHQPTPGLSGVVGSNDGQTFPELLYITVNKPQVPKTSLKKTFALGQNIPGVEGKWYFYTSLNLTDKTKIKYTTEWDDWQDKDLDGLTVSSATLNVTLQKDVALDAESIEFILKGKKGQLRGETKLMGDETQNVTIDLKGQPVSEITGAELNVHLNGVGKDLKPDQEIKISNLKVTVNGYYDRKL